MAVPMSDARTCAKAVLHAAHPCVRNYVTELEDEIRRLKNKINQQWYEVERKEEELEELREECLSLRLKLPVPDGLPF